jgi:hypothetical protein
MYNDLMMSGGVEKMKKRLMKSMEVSKDSKRSCTWHEVGLVNQVRELGRLTDNELTEIQLAAENVVTEEMKLAILSWERRNISKCDDAGVNDC